MPIPISVPWDNPWLSPVYDDDPAPRAFDGNGNTTISVGPDEVPLDWHLGVIASEIQVTFTCVSSRAVEILLYDNDPMGSALIAGDTFAVNAGTHTVSLPIVAQVYDLSFITFSFGGPEEAGDTLVEVVVVSGSPPVSDFWTSFTKSYEIP